MSEKKITRLRELADAVTNGRESWHEFTMRIPADPERDADLVLTWAADEIEQLQGKLNKIRAYIEHRYQSGDMKRARDEIQKILAGSLPAKDS